MTPFESLIAEFAKNTGLPLEADAQESCSLETEDLVITLQYRRERDDVVLFAPVSEPGEELPPETLRAALELACNGKGTRGNYLGLFAGTLLLRQGHARQLPRSLRGHAPALEIHAVRRPDRRRPRRPRTCLFGRRPRRPRRAYRARRPGTRARTGRRPARLRIPRLIQIPWEVTVHDSAYGSQLPLLKRNHISRSATAAQCVPLPADG